MSVLLNLCLNVRSMQTRHQTFAACPCTVPPALSQAQTLKLPNGVMDPVFGCLEDVSLQDPKPRTPLLPQTAASILSLYSPNYSGRKIKIFLLIR